MVEEERSDLPAVVDGPGWRGDEHRLQVAAAEEAGLRARAVELDSYTDGFKRGIVVEDPHDGAVVARGRTVLTETQVRRSLGPTLRYLGVASDLVMIRVHDGRFELRLAKAAADASQSALDYAWTALQVWVGFGLLGVAAQNFLPAMAAPIIWGIGLLLGAWQLKKGVASGRAMLAARLAVALGMLAQAEQLILPPGGDDADSP